MGNVIQTRELGEPASLKRNVKNLKLFHKGENSLL